jgi:hypothetical protein
MRLDKIHCENEDDVYATDCGIMLCRGSVVSVGGWVFARLKDEHKCKRCKKKEDSRPGSKK